MKRPIISFEYAIKDILRDKANFDILSGFLSELIECSQRHSSGIFHDTSQKISD